MLCKYDEHHVMVKSIIHNVYVNRGIETEVQGIGSRLLYVATLFSPLSRSSKWVNENPSRRIWSRGNDTHFSLSLSRSFLLFPHLRKLKLSLYRSYIKAHKRTKYHHKTNKMIGEAFIHTAINLNQHLASCCALMWRKHAKKGSSRYT